jgi:hypothetical protein
LRKQKIKINQNIRGQTCIFISSLSFSFLYYFSSLPSSLLLLLFLVLFLSSSFSSRLVFCSFPFCFLFSFQQKNYFFRKEVSQQKEFGFRFDRSGSLWLVDIDKEVTLHNTPRVYRGPDSLRVYWIHRRIE